MNRECGWAWALKLMPADSTRFAWLATKGQMNREGTHFNGKGRVRVATKAARAL
jgi:hypothetical protein